MRSNRFLSIHGIVLGALLLLRPFSCGAQDSPPIVIPPVTPAEALPPEMREAPHLIAAFESDQGEAGERLAVFDDGVVAFVVRWKERHVLRRKNLAPQELAVVRQVCLEALVAPDELIKSGTVLVDANVRRLSIEIVSKEGASRFFVFDDLTQLPLALGRARGALEDLRARFLVREVEKESLWDPADIHSGDLLVRRADGLVFEVVRDDTYEANLELRDKGRNNVIFFAARADLPKVFEKPIQKKRRSPAP